MKGRKERKRERKGEREGERMTGVVASDPISIN
jgi:hypothetical protein